MSSTRLRVTHASLGDVRIEEGPDADDLLVLAQETLRSLGIVPGIPSDDEHEFLMADVAVPHAVGDYPIEAGKAYFRLVPRPQLSPLEAIEAVDEGSSSHLPNAGSGRRFERFVDLPIVIAWDEVDGD